MHARKFLAGLATTAVAVSVLALHGRPGVRRLHRRPRRHAPARPVAADLIGVGSDTSQGVVEGLAADAYNATGTRASKIVSPTPRHRRAAPSPCPAWRHHPAQRLGCRQGPALRRAATTPTSTSPGRPRPINDAETADGLQAFPFAVDTLVMVTSGQRRLARAGHPDLRPRSLGIYKGTDHQLEPGRRHRRRHQAADPAERLGHPELLHRPAQGRQRRRRRRPRPGRDRGPGARPDRRSRTTPTRSRRSRKGRAGTGRHRLRGRDRASAPTVRSTTWSAAPTSANAAVLAAFGAERLLLLARRQAARSRPPASGSCSRRRKGGVCGAADPDRDQQLHHRPRSPTTTTVTVTSASASSARVVAKVTGSSAPERHRHLLRGRHPGRRRTSR